MATNKVVVAGSDVTASQLKDLFRQIDDRSINGEIIQAVLDHRNPFPEVGVLKSGFVSDLANTALQLTAWQKFYRELFGIKLDTSKIVIPKRRAGFDRLIVVAKGLKLNQVFQKCGALFGTWSSIDDLDKSVTKNDREPTASYAIWIRDRVEADQELKGRSADDLAERKVSGITLLERMLWELFYFKETGKHLDIKNVTLCSGSRHSDGLVPHAYWGPDDRKFYVDWTNRDYADDDLRSREAVSV
ncbi:hypothetical protein IT398_02855 [Candidatus Nomurabacteria bacterium]|nr:hypothetical protein [Candidatus Nomurabacteria bacterium]